MMPLFFHIPKMKINNENSLDRPMAQKYPLGSLHPALTGGRLT
jgi:hypothetical protein